MSLDGLYIARTLILNHGSWPLVYVQSKWYLVYNI